MHFLTFRRALHGTLITLLMVVLLSLLAQGAYAQGAPSLVSDKNLDDQSLVNGDPCGPPCFDKITPGQTKFEDAVAILKADSRFKNVTVQTDNQKVATWATQADQVCCTLVAGEDGIVITLQIKLAPKVTAKQIIDKYGTPPYTTAVDYSQQEVAVSLIYPKNGFVAWVVPGGTTSNVAETSPVVLAVYLDAKQFENVVKTTPLNGWPGYTAFQTFKASTPVSTPLPPPTSPALPTSAASADDLKSPCYTAAVPKVDPIANAPRQFGAPDKVTDPTHTYCGFIATERGVIVIELYIKDAPQHVNSFAFLANKGYYDGITWHRVIEGFVAQTGDPTGTGTGGPGYTIPLETSTGLKYDRPGLLGMARTNDPNSAGSQFFITYAPLPSLDPQPGGGYTIFGRVVKGLEVVQMIRARDQGDPPGDKLVWARVVDVTATK